MLAVQRRTLATLSRGQNLVEKIVQQFAVDLAPGEKVKSGDYVSIKPHHVMTHDNTAAVLDKFTKLPVDKIANSRQPVFTIDHNIQDTSEKNIAKYERIKQFAAEHGVDFYPPGRGIGHQIMIEEGYAFPQTMTVASDSHSNMYGGVGALGTPLVRTDAAAIWATGKTWWKVPPVVKVELKGALRKTGKDVIVALCGLFGNDEVLNCAIEFHGEGVKSLSVDDRLAISNMTTEWGALAGVFPVDEKTLEWFERRVNHFEKSFKLIGGLKNSDTVPSLRGVKVHPRYNRANLDKLKGSLLRADHHAFYSKTLSLNLSTLQDSFVSGPNSVKVATPLSELEAKNIKINKAYLISCTNSRFSDIEQAAKVVKGKKIASGVEFYVAAASSEVQKDAEATGHWQALMDAGAKPLPAGCGPCIGLGIGLLEDGEVGISASNRNFKGRMGSRNAQAYLASPSVVAASAVAGYIKGTESVSDALKPFTSSVVHEKVADESDTAPGAAYPGFPEVISGDAIYCTADNLNTDGIYPGKYTYREDLTPTEMARVAMENYDQTFTGLVKKGDILIAGRNFGSGSSREQAATSLKYLGIKLVLAESFSETYARNALNNGLLCLQAPELVNDMKKLGWDLRNKTIVTGVHLSIVPAKGVITAQFPKQLGTKTYKIDRVGRIAQELVATDGLEQLIAKEARMNK